MSQNPILHCSFCGKTQHEVRKLIAGNTVYICDDCVELLRWDLIDLLAGQLLGQVPFAVVGMKGAAAELVVRCNDFAAVTGEDLGSIAIHIRKNEILRTAGQEGDAKAFHASPAAIGSRTTACRN